jgi:hypothetical protein
VTVQLLLNLFLKTLEPAGIISGNSTKYEVRKINGQKDFRPVFPGKHESTGI